MSQRSGVRRLRPRWQRDRAKQDLGFHVGALTQPSLTPNLKPQPTSHLLPLRFPRPGPATSQQARDHPTPHPTNSSPLPYGVAQNCRTLPMSAKSGRRLLTAWQAPPQDTAGSSNTSRSLPKTAGFDRRPAQGDQLPVGRPQITARGLPQRASSVADDLPEVDKQRQTTLALQSAKRRSLGCQSACAPTSHQHKPCSAPRLRTTHSAR